ncbi:MAG: pilus assembly protein PilQ, partial [Selenomonadaceae bacterium]|nr:pilus assembly protein PilQ [Selenomonadaceae bacterium]
IHTEVSSPQYVEEMNAYSFQKRSADTMVRLKDGETMVIGGLISSEEIKSMSKVPFLGDLPILGNLFKSVHSSVANSEIFIILKAKIVS